MVVIGTNLEGLIEQYDLAPKAAFDQFSLTLRLHNVVFVPLKGRRAFVYPIDESSPFFEQRTLEQNRTLDLKPGETALACSTETIRMPKGYMGFLQTKGSLARVMCAVHMNDAQIEPGFVGRITFEVANHAPFPVSIRVGAPVAQLFILSCSDRETQGYSGRYANSDIPTLFVPKL